ncbi:RNA polymerase sigma factor [Paludisphaera soli]|uniref:RNA polymerase sigma factor n=1 Tax=Paludisphaera soli TaxID=2712865 RepID=UPI0013EC0930|nr:sigma-70 family RNA polymerase sigma factor [Paludisphaera soli]
MTRNLDDFSLVEACRAGRSEAYGVLVGRCQGRIYPMLVRLLGSAEDAQDVLQDAFLRGFEKLGQYQGESSFSTWMYRIALNLAMSRLRKRKMRRVLRLLDTRRGRPAVDPPDESPASVPSHAAEQAEREALVEAALESLEPEHRAVVILKDFEGRRYDEIGDLLGIPVGTVRSRLHRARQQLRRRLRPLVDDESPAHSIHPDVEQALS